MSQKAFVVGKHGGAKRGMAACVLKQRYESAQEAYDTTEDIRRTSGKQLYCYPCGTSGGTHYHLTKQRPRQWPPKGVRTDRAYFAAREVAYLADKVAAAR